MNLWASCAAAPTHLIRLGLILEVEAAFAFGLTPSFMIFRIVLASVLSLVSGGKCTYPTGLLALFDQLSLRL